MLLKLLVSVFERAKSKITSTGSTGRTSSESDEEFDPHPNGQQSLSSGPSIIHQQPRLSISKWLCTTSASVDKAILATKTPKFRRSSSWRSLKERGNHPVEHFSSRTLSVDELHRNDKQYCKNLPVRAQQQQQPHRRDRLSLVCHSPITTLSPQRAKILRRSDRRNNQQISSRTNTNSGGGDSGYSEESFTTATLPLYTRPLHTSCPHCHCEQRSSFQNYANPSLTNYSTDSTSSDTTIHKENTSSYLSYERLFQHKQSLSASRSYPHIKPLPRTASKPSLHQQPRRPRTLSAKRRRNLSCDSSFRPRTQTHQPSLNPSSTYLKPFSTLPKTSHVFGELNLAAIELDSLRTSLSSSYSSSTSSSSSINIEEKSRKSSRNKGMYLVWHEYQNSSLLSATNGSKIFSVIRGDQVRLLRRIGKSTLLVQKEDDGSIGFLPQSCLAHDQINSFLSVKGLRETVL